MFEYSKTKENDHLSILNGIRVLSLLYVMLGHGYSALLFSPIYNFKQLDLLLHPWLFYIVPGGFFSVDTFFFMSAFLGAYLMLEKFYSKKSMNFGLIYFHRFYRLVIPIGLVIALYLTCYIFLGDGPIWYQSIQPGIEGCKEQWWYALLFVSNMFPWNHANG